MSYTVISRSSKFMQARRQWHNIIQVMKGKDSQRRILYEKNIIKMEVKLDIPRYTKLKEFTANKHALQVILKGVLKAEVKAN